MLFQGEVMREKQRFVPEEGRRWSLYRAAAVFSFSMSNFRTGVENSPAVLQHVCRDIEKICSPYSWGFGLADSCLE